MRDVSHFIVKTKSEQHVIDKKWNEELERF